MYLQRSIPIPGEESGFPKVSVSKLRTSKLPHRCQLTFFRVGGRGQGLLVAHVVVLHGLRLVVRGEGEDEPHHGLEVALEHLAAADLVHADLLGGHELQHPLQVLPHPLQRLGLGHDPRNLLSG